MKYADITWKTIPDMKMPKFDIGGLTDNLIKTFEELYRNNYLIIGTVIAVVIVLYIIYSGFKGG